MRDDQVTSGNPRPVRWWGALSLAFLAVAPSVLLAEAGSWVLPSSVYRAGANGAEFQTDVRLLNVGSRPVTVTPAFYDQATGEAFPAPAFEIPARSQASHDNVLHSLFGRELAQGAYGPIRFSATDQIVVSSNVKNVKACGGGATFGSWLPGIDASLALEKGVIPQLAVSGNPATGYRTNVVFMNPGNLEAMVTARVRLGGGALLSSQTFGPLLENGFSQVPLDSFPGVSGTTNRDLWLEFSSDRPVLAFASVIDNSSGDPFVIVAAPDTGGGPAHEEVAVVLPGGVPLVLVRIPSGGFDMGAPAGERGQLENEGPVHDVLLTRDFYLGKFEVTQEQWTAIMGSNPSGFATCGGACPVERVSWNDVAGSGGFLAKLNAHLSATGQAGGGKLRLPTEAEWEYAARGGTNSPFSFAAPATWDMECGTFPEAAPYMWWCGNAGGATHSVGQRQANPRGLHDMHGNVWEWCQDWYGTYPAPPAIDPAGPPFGTLKVIRGGSWHPLGGARDCRSASRHDEGAGSRRNDLGFRVARPY